MSHYEPGRRFMAPKRQGVLGKLKHGDYHASSPLGSLFVVVHRACISLVGTKGEIYIFPTLDAPWTPGKVTAPARGSDALVSAIPLPEPALCVVLIPPRPP